MDIYPFLYYWLALCFDIWYLAVFLLYEFGEFDPLRRFKVGVLLTFPWIVAAIITTLSCGLERDTKFYRKELRSSRWAVYNEEQQAFQPSGRTTFKKQEENWSLEQIELKDKARMENWEESVKIISNMGLFGSWFEDSPRDYFKKPHRR